MLTKSPLRVLHLEDSTVDAAVVESVLKSEKIDCVVQRVDDPTHYDDALRSEPDLVLADIHLPGFHGMQALEMARRIRPNVPFIVLSGTVGEEFAIETLKSGATDYVLKNRLARLGPAVRRAIQEASDHHEYKQLEGQFIQAQKMEVVGHLAGGVAHDFNNILSVIVGYTDLMKQQIPGETGLAKQLEEVRHAAARATALTRQLLVFSSHQPLHSDVLDVTEILEGIDKMLRRLVGENIDLTVAAAPDAGRIRADSSYIGQVIMNLVVNARDAMPDGGALRIEAKNVLVDHETVRVGSRAPGGDYVCFSVTDSGTGMTPEVKARIFEAFFTTKPKGKGTGLGLATCQTIVKQCNGFIDVESEVGKGTTFHVFFPRVFRAATGGALAASTPAVSPRGTETLLLVEDDPAVQRLACEVLEAQGYRVLRAGNGHEGLRVAREFKGGPIDLVITDVVMPQMSGQVMAEWLRAGFPDIKVLFSSGYNETSIDSETLLDRGTGFLPKPYTPHELARKARELLDVKRDQAL